MSNGPPAEAQAHEVETVLRRLHPDPKAGIQAEPAEPSSVDRRPYVDAGDSSTSCLQPYLGIAGLRPNGGFPASLRAVSWKKRKNEQPNWMVGDLSLWWKKSWDFF